MDFKAPQELWNPPSKAVHGTLHGSDGHSKRNYLQDRANFHRSQAWQIVLIFNTDNIYVYIYICIITSWRCLVPGHAWIMAQLKWKCRYLTICSSLVAPEFTSSVTSDENFVKITTFPLQHSLGCQWSAHISGMHQRYAIPWRYECHSMALIPAYTQRNKNEIITSKRRFGVIITCLLR